MHRSAVVLGLSFAACGPLAPAIDTEGAPGTTTDADATAAATSTGPDAPPTSAGTVTGDEPGPKTRRCEALDACDQLDILIVVDNSRSMAEEQLRLAQAAPAWIEDLRHSAALSSREFDVNIMVTTTDVGHPLCEPLQKPGYTPARGAPSSDACNSRLERFDSVDGLLSAPSTCTTMCPPGVAAEPTGPFIHEGPDGDNIIGGDPDSDLVAAALACLVPQGIDGCEMESPLEAMRLALAPDASWNAGDRPFLRPGAPALMIVLVTDEADCSVLDPAFFDPAATDPAITQFWEIDPDSGTLDAPTSAVCWNGGMRCEDADQDGVYEECVPEDRGVLHPVDRYAELLRELERTQEREVAMIVIGGVPPVTRRDEFPPFGPVAGGILDLVFRTWLPADVPDGPATPAQMEYEFGIGPGCVGTGGAGLPPGRIAAVCQALDSPPTAEDPIGRTRCCFESVCDESFEVFSSCMVGQLTQREPPLPF